MLRDSALKLSRSGLLNLALIFALVALAILGRQFSPLLLPKADISGVALPGCDLQRQACAANLPGGGSLELSITPRPIPFLQALRVEVATAGVRPRKVEVDFAGATMNMGYNRSELAAAAPGHHVGQSSLPVCVSGGMTWVATVIVETDSQRISVPFRFEVKH